MKISCKWLSWCTSFFVLYFTNANAQKLPSVQKNSLRAVENIKIDGKTTEWNAEFQAYNHAIDCFYTLSNDDDYLYLTLQATDPSVIKRIVNSGITFTIEPSLKKNENEAVSITFPVLETRLIINFNNWPKIKPGDENAEKKADSLMKVANLNLTNHSKFIKTKGIKGLDTLLSIYNENGIKAAALLDNKMRYTYELAVSLKNLNRTTNSPVKFAYNIRINLVKPQGVTTSTSSSGMRVMNFTSNTPVVGQEATDFWGEYTLVKK